jgi:hypothetical protein
MSALILVANASEACLYTCKNLRTQPLSLVDELIHPESRQKGVDLISDRPGHYAVGSKARSAYEKSNPKEVEAERFICELASKFHDMVGAKKPDKAIVVMPAHLYGLFGKHFHGGAAELVHICKDYTKCKEDELLEHIRQHIFI